MVNYNFKDESGKKYGRLSVIERGSTTNDGQIRWVCLCECGNRKEVRGPELRKGKTSSCGCLNKEINSKRSIGNQYYKNWKDQSKIFGLSNHPLRAIRKSMIHRCYNENNPFYKNYGGRGIKVCSNWLDSLKSFYDWAMTHGWIKGLSIDRKNNNLDYTPENCQWITISENSRKNCILGKHRKALCAKRNTSSI